MDGWVEVVRMCTEVVWNGCNDSIGLMKGVMTLTEDKKGEEKSLDCLQKKAMLGEKRCDEDET